DEDVGPAELRLDPFGERAHRRRIAHVRDERQRLAAARPDLRGGLLRAGEILPARQHDARPRARQLAGNRAPDPARPSTHDGGLAAAALLLRESAASRGGIGHGAMISVRLAWASTVPARRQETLRSIQRVIFVSISPGPTSRNLRWPSAIIRSNVVFQSV